MINRLIEPSGGHIYFDGEDVTRGDPVELRRRIGYVIQQVGLFPHQSIAHNVGTVPRLLGWDKGRVDARVDELLELVGLEPALYRDRYPGQLSGGQQQRVGVARALAADPPVLLMDEPFGAIDPVTRTRLQEEFLRLQQELRKTIVFVTHDIDEAVKLGDRIALLNVGGVLEQYDTPAQILGAPATEFVASFVGSNRALKRLKVTAINTELLDHPPVISRDPLVVEIDGTSYPVDARVDVSDSLEAALAQSLLTDDGVVAVISDHQILGTLHPDAIHRAVRESMKASRDER
jgi:osmoprotectant transport system ATP-binding protein